MEKAGRRGFCSAMTSQMVGQRARARVTDDEIFDEADFEIIAEAIGEDGQEMAWEVEECIDLSKKRQRRGKF